MHPIYIEVNIMPSKPMKPCKRIGCPNLTVDTYCQDHKQTRPHYDMNRGNATQRGYGSRWRKARGLYLKQHPSCNRCGELSNVVDHIVPHRGDYNLFWDKNNWQPLCTRCHNIKTATEDGGFGRAKK
jgi:5-methylcytosine-specific restriction protein A